MNRLRKRQILILALALVVLFQGSSLAVERLRDAWQVYNTIIQPAGWRGANFYQSQNFADFVRFLNVSIPEDSRAVLPPGGIGPGAISHTPAMQFFLAPRDVVNCPEVESTCAADLANGGAYILVIGNQFPGEAVVKDPERLHRFNDTWGVYVPPGAPAANPAANTGSFNGLVDVAWALLVSFLGLVVMAAAGLPAAAKLAPGLPYWVHLPLSFGLYFGCLSLGLYLALLAGLPLRPALILALSLIWALLNGALFLSSRMEPRTASPAQTRRVYGRQDIPWLAALVLAAGLAAITAVGKGYHTTDAIVLWGAKGYGIAAHGLQVGAAGTGTRTTTYPLNIPLAIAAFQNLGLERLPASKLIFPGYALALSLLLYGYLRRRASAAVAGLATLALATSPLFQRHAAIGYANLPLAYAFTGAVLLAAMAEEESVPGSSRLRLGAGLFFVLSAWMRPEGLALSAAAALYLAARALRRNPRPDQRGAAGLLAPLAAYAAIWLATEPLVYYGGGTTTDEAGRAALSGILGGSLHLNELLYLLRYFALQWFDPETWGFFGIALLGSFALVAVSRRFDHRQPSAGPALIGLGYLAAILAAYYLLSYDPTHDLSWWLSTGFTRMILPGVVLIWTGLIGFYLPEPERGS